MNKNTILSVITSLGLASTAFLSSCASSTPESRIEKNPVKYESLSTADKNLARQGKVKKGMHKDAVFIAWGKPAGVSAGNRNGQEFEKWVYTRSTPVYHHGIYPRFGYNWGRRNCGRGGYYGVGYNPGVSYVHRTSATVDFNRYDKVSAWQARR